MKKARKVFLILCVFLVSCVSSEKQTKKAELHHQLAISFMKKCQYPSALAELKKALKTKPKDPFLHHSIALLYFQFKEYKKTLKHLKTALALNPEFTDARVYLGRSLIEIGQEKEALKELEKARKDLTYKYSENIHAHLGLAYYKQKKYSLAEKHFSVARIIKKEDCFLALYHAKSFYFQNQFQKALEVLEPAKKWCQTNLPLCFPPSFSAYFFAALAYDKTGQKLKALSNLKIFLKNAEKNNVFLKEAKKLMNMWQGFQQDPLRKNQVPFSKGLKKSAQGTKNLINLEQYK